LLIFGIFAQVFFPLFFKKKQLKKKMSSSDPSISPQIPLYDWYQTIHQSPVSYEICCEVLRKSIEYWIVKRNIKKLNVLDLGTCDGYTIYSLWNKAIKSFKSLEKIHIYVSNTSQTQSAFDDNLSLISKTRPELDRRIVIHVIPSTANFREYRTCHFKDFKMNIITCWNDTRISWADPCSTQCFFSILSQSEFIRPGGLFLFLHLDGQRLFSLMDTEKEKDNKDNKENKKKEKEIETDNVYAWTRNICFATSQLMYQNSCSAFVRHPWDLLLYSYVGQAQEPLTFSSYSFLYGMIDQVAQKYGFQSVFRENVAKFARHLLFLNKKSTALDESWWREEENWSFAKLFVTGVYCFNPEEESYSFDASQVFFNNT